ncbi:MAG: 2-C-methyl-D-erythritol 4-phosphate cytidylyltransferase [Gammaproteobacteria bacterium]|nr:2-C-methyl-D-erythritol 4-phosphate cytidylyltransferase [Gammaproteobacteria bacterium]
MSRLWVIVPAAGRGTRFGGECPKQYLPLAGETVLAQTLRRLDGAGALAILVGTADGNLAMASSLSLKTPLRGFSGGAERALTVLNGLRALATEAHADDLVAVHDAARPCLRLADCLSVVAAAAACPAGALLARPVADTVKRADEAGCVAATTDRRGLWLAQTPQVFAYDRLKTALEEGVAAQAALTDEASAVERLGDCPRLVMGHADNIKITLPEDLRMAELYLAAQAEEETLRHADRTRF